MKDRVLKELYKRRSPLSPPSQKSTDITQLLNAVNGPLEPGQTLNAFMSFSSSKSGVAAVRKLDREDVAKLIDVL